MHNSTCNQVILSDTALQGILAETYERFDTETGGILLGHHIDGNWYVTEVIDPGPNSVFRTSYFEYDTNYVNHLTNKIARLYSCPPKLLGLWHRHPGSLDRFSSTDDGTNAKFALLNPVGAISGIVNLDPDFRLTMYHVAMPLQYTRVPLKTGNHLIPTDLMARKTSNDFRGLLYDYNGIQAKHKIYNMVVSARNWITNATKSTIQDDVDEGVGTKREITLISASTETLLNCFDAELQFLTEQTEYDYAVSVNGNSILVTMDYTGGRPNMINHIQLDLSLKNNTNPEISINGVVHPYAVNAIYNLINSKSTNLSTNLAYD